MHFFLLSDDFYVTSKWEINNNKPKPYNRVKWTAKNIEPWKISLKGFTFVYNLFFMVKFLECYNIFGLYFRHVFWVGAINVRGRTTKTRDTVKPNRAAAWEEKNATKFSWHRHADDRRVGGERDDNNIIHLYLYTIYYYTRFSSLFLT